MDKILLEKSIRTMTDPDEVFFAEGIMAEAARYASDYSKCLRSKCGAAIVRDGLILGLGTNSPAGDVALERCVKDDLPPDFKSDRTCCVHAEQRAIMKALSAAARGDDLPIAGATMYFIRLDGEGNPVRAKRLKCTVCSKLMLDAGLKEVVMWMEDGYVAYTAKEFNRLSFRGLL